MMMDDRGNCLTTEDCIDEDSKVKVEETTVNLNCVKSEPNEDSIDFGENLHVRHYKVPLKYGSVIGEPFCNVKLEEYEDNLVGFLNNDVIMEKNLIKLEDIKEEGDVNFDCFHCSKCNGNYKSYCLKCSSLSHILNNTVSLVKSETELNTVPTNILEIRDTSMGKGVFLLIALPKNVTLGPFEGLSAVEGTKGYSWKISDKKLALVNNTNGNWMKDVVCAANASFKNLDIVQMNGSLYFQTNRKIMEGEELLVHLDDEEIHELDNSEECYFIPQKQQRKSNLFACTRCCLGFSIVKCLMEHKSKCPHGKSAGNIKDFELVECHNCNIWLEKQEHREYHRAYCLEKYHRFWNNRSEALQTILETETEKSSKITTYKKNISCSLLC